MQDQALRELCELPLTFRNGESSWSELVRAVVHKKRAGRHTEAEIASCLQENLHLIEEWLTWSADQRATSGWFFQRTERGYESGLLTAHAEMTQSEFCEDASRACARFIVHELQLVSTNVPPDYSINFEVG